MLIGFFDSGIGGLTVLYEALKILPRERYIYYADSLNAPYGVKPKDEVKEYIFEAVDFLIKRGVQAIVVACNTATSVAIEDLRSKYNIPILGMEPAIKPAVERSANIDKKVLVTATPLTLKEEKLKNLIARVGNEHIIDLLPLPRLVEFAENFEFSEEIVWKYLKEELSRFNLEDYGTIVLGCTHFPLYKDIFRKLLPENVDIIDGSKGTVKNLKRILDSQGCISEGKSDIVYYISGKKVEDNVLIGKYNELLGRLRKLDIECNG